MARPQKNAPSTALATTGGGSIEATKRRITVSAATDMVKQLAAQRYREAKAAEKTKLARIEQGVGGQVKRVDDSVIVQAKALMTRIALIAKHRSDSNVGSYNYDRSSNTQLDAIVKKLGGVIGELEAFQLTNRAAGLFERIDEGDFTARVYGGQKNPLAHVGRKIRAEATKLLEGFEIVEDTKTVKRGRGKNATTETIEGEVLDLQQLREDAADEGDESIDESECRVCGCTDSDACEGGCRWIEIDLCSRCVGKEVA